MSRGDARALTGLVLSAILVVATALVGTVVSHANEIHVLNALVAVAIVVALYVFVGNSGVLSFGHASFVAIGAFAAGLLSIPVESKSGVLPDVFPVLRDHSYGNLTTLAIAAAAGGVAAFLVGMPLMRLSGLSAGIATFAVLEITHNVLRYWTKVGPGATTLSLVPETTDLLQATVGALLVIAAAFLYERSTPGRLLRATSMDPFAAQAVGVDVHRQRLLAFTLSGALSGLAGGLLVHFLGSITTEQVYLELTFLTLAMLVIGGMTTLWGAVVGAIVVSGVNSVLGEAENEISIGGLNIDLPQGTRIIVLGVLMALALILRPAGLTGGRVPELPWRPRRLSGDDAAAGRPSDSTAGSRQ